MDIPLEGGEGDGVRMPPSDRRIVDDDARRRDHTLDHPGGCREVLQVMVAPLCEGDHERSHADPTSRTPGTLDVVRRRRRDVPQQDGLNVPEIDPQLERGRTAEHVDAARDELPLDAAAFRSRPLCGVLLDRHTDRLEDPIGLPHSVPRAPR